MYLFAAIVDYRHQLISLCLIHRTRKFCKTSACSTQLKVVSISVSTSPSTDSFSILIKFSINCSFLATPYIETHS